MSYSDIRTAAKSSGIRVGDLLPLDQKNDPFYSGTEGDVEKGKWFAELWQTYGATGHIRRIHYKILNVLAKPGGDLYRNTKKDWAYLQASSKHARYLGLINAEEFTDRRNSDPLFFGSWSTEGKEPEQYYERFEWDAPSLRSGRIWDPETEISGYDYNTADQPYIVEIWVEKSTVSDELLPICREYQATYVEGTGFTSVTRLIQLLRRAEETGKPIRVFYISDLDSAGQAMPVQAARHLQFWTDKLAPTVDIRLTPLVLTPEQQEEYQFTMDEDGAKVELDAMTVERPGLFEKIVTDAVAMYHDHDIEWALTKAKAEAKRVSDADLDVALRPYRERIKDLESQMQDIVDRYKGFAEEVTPITAELQALEAQVAEAVDAAEADFMPPERPRTEYQAIDDREWLYDSARSYDEETRRLLDFKERKGVKK